MRNLLAKLGAFADQPTNAPLAFDADRMAFSRRLDELLARRGGKPDEIAYRIGAAATTARIATAIEQSLGPNDLFVHVEEGFFLLVFPLLDRWESRLKAAKMRRDIEQKLAGIEIELEEASLAGPDKVVFAPCADLDSLVAAMLHESESGVKSPAAAVAGSKSSAPIGEAYASGQRLTGIDFVYRPMLTLQTNIVSTFLVVPVREVSAGHFDSGYRVLLNSTDPFEIFDLDQLTLTQTSLELRRFIDSGGRSLFALPVHFETLASQRRCRDFCQLAAEKLAGIEKRIVFEMVGLPDKIPQARLVNLVTALSPHARTVIARFPSDSFEFMDYRSTGLHAVGIDVYESSKRERTLMGEIDRFVDTARKSRLKSYIQGVRSLSMLTAAMSGGFDYIAGHALGQPCTRAENIKTFQLSEMHRAVIGAYAGSAAGGPVNVAA
jgi:hypothetical protein